MGFRYLETRNPAVAGVGIVFHEAQMPWAASCSLDLQGLSLPIAVAPQVVINAPMTKTGNKPRMIAQTTKVVTIRMSCLHKAERPIGYLEE
jgi:hypothetical protein